MEPLTVGLTIAGIALPLLGYFAGIWKSKTKNEKTKNRLEKFQKFCNIMVRSIEKVEPSGAKLNPVKAAVKELSIEEDVYDEMDVAVQDIVGK